MNEAPSRLDRAKQFIAIAESGDSKREAYKAAAEEIVAELQLRTTQRQIARHLGKDESFVRAIVAWHKSGYKAKTPWLADEGATDRAARSHAKKLLREAPAEVIEQIIAELPNDRQQILGAAAGNSFLKARQEVEEQERNRTPEERRQIKADVNRAVQPVRQALGVMGVQLTVVGSLELALEQLQDLVAREMLTPEALAQIDAAWEAFNAELRFARQMAGMEVSDG